MSKGFGSLEPSGPSTSSFGSFGSFGDTLGLQNLEISENPKYEFAKKKYGKIGKPTRLKVNFFDIKFRNNISYFHYNIEIIKEENQVSKGKKRSKSEAKKDSTPKSKKTPKRLNDEIFKEVFNKNEKVFQTNKVLPVFDGEKNFYSRSQFNLPNSSWSGVVTVKDKDKSENFRVNITIPETSHGQNLDSLLGRNLSIMPVELQALDIIIRNGPRLKNVALGQNFFLKCTDENWEKYKFDIMDGRDADPMKYGQFGNYQCAKITEKGIRYNVDRAMAVFTYGGMVKDAFSYILGKSFKFPLTRDRLYDAEEQLKGLKFSAKHLNYKRTFIISGISQKFAKKKNLL